MGHILIQVSATNRCGRTLSVNEVWFEASGWRGGSVVHTSHGHPFDEMRNRATVEIAFDLPGSTTWYDEIRLRLR